MHRMAVVAAMAAACGGADKPAARQADDGIEPGELPMSRRAAVPDMDEDSDDGVEVAGLRGRISAYDIQEGVRPHARALEACYNRNVGKKRFIGGNVELKYELARDGSVRWVQLVRSDLGAWPVEKCLLETARTMRFVEPQGGEADFTLPLEFSARRASQWYADRGLEEVAELTGELAECAEMAESAPVEVTLYVGARGQVQSVGFASLGAEPVADAWKDCAAERIGSWTLSDPLGAVTKTSFTYNPE